MRGMILLPLLLAALTGCEGEAGKAGGLPVPERVQREADPQVLALGERVLEAEFTDGASPSARRS